MPIIIEDINQTAVIIIVYTLTVLRLKRAIPNQLDVVEAGIIAGWIRCMMHYC